MTLATNGLAHKFYFAGALFYQKLGGRRNPIHIDKNVICHKLLSDDFDILV